jgi:hypothetical protein
VVKALSSRPPGDFSKQKTRFFPSQVNKTTPPIEYRDSVSVYQLRSQSIWLLIPRASPALRANSSLSRPLKLPLPHSRNSKIVVSEPHPYVGFFPVLPLCICKYQLASANKFNSTQRSRMLLFQQMPPALRVSPTSPSSPFSVVSHTMPHGRLAVD